MSIDEMNTDEKLSLDSVGSTSNMEGERPLGAMKRKGRALAAARLGLKDAIDALEAVEHKSAAEDAERALKRSYCMEIKDSSK